MHFKGFMERGTLASPWDREPGRSQTLTFAYLRCGLRLRIYPGSGVFERHRPETDRASARPVAFRLIGQGSRPMTRVATEPHAEARRAKFLSGEVVPCFARS